MNTLKSSLLTSAYFRETSEVGDINYVKNDELFLLPVYSVTNQYDSPEKEQFDHFFETCNDIQSLSIQFNASFSGTKKIEIVSAIAACIDSCGLNKKILVSEDFTGLLYPYTDFIKKFRQDNFFFVKD